MFSYRALRDRIDAHYPLYIDGRWTESADGSKLEVLCPANGAPLCDVAAATGDDVDRAVTAARAAFPAWRGTSPDTRYRIVMELHRRISLKLDTLIAAESLETGRPLGPTRAFVALGMERLLSFGGILRTCEDGTLRDAPGVHAMAVREPLGVVAALCAWNLPLLWALWTLTPALAAGNAVILMPSSQTPIGTLELTKAIADLLPPGVLNVITGGDEAAGALKRHPGIDKVALPCPAGIDEGTLPRPSGLGKGPRFGGHRARGHAVAAAARPSPTGDSDGRSTGIYFADIGIRDLPKAVAAIVEGCILNSGQVMGMQSRVLIETPIYEWMVTRVAKALEGIRVGPPWQEDAQMGPVASPSRLEDVLGYVELGREEGARVIQGGVRLTGEAYAAGSYAAPTALADVNSAMRVGKEAILGPVVCLMPFQDEAEAIEIANEGRHGLAAGVFTGDLRRGLRAAERLCAGSVSINHAAGHALAAMGGEKAAGRGWERDRAAFDAYCRMKTITF